jgi:hypothetical protein
MLLNKMEEIVQGFNAFAAPLSILGDDKEDFLFNSKNESLYGF